MPKHAAPFDLDALEREGDAREPFAVALGGKTYLLDAPDEYDYVTGLAVRDALVNGGAPDAMRLLVKPEDREAFFANPLPVWKVNGLMEAYNKHFTLTSPEPTE
jgi:hypothetical protein